MNVTTVGIDLAKNVFSVHGVDAHGKVTLKKTVSRSKLLECFANLLPCVVTMEACSGAHHWARALRSLGHDARIIAPRFVIPYRTRARTTATTPSPSAKPSAVLPCALFPSNPSNSRPSSACTPSPQRRRGRTHRPDQPATRVIE